MWSTRLIIGLFSTDGAHVLRSTTKSGNTTDGLGAATSWETHCARADGHQRAMEERASGEVARETRGGALEQERWGVTRGISLPTESERKQKYRFVRYVS